MNRFQWIRDLIDAFGGRRFFLTLGAGVVHTGLRIADLLSQEIYRDLTITTVGVYIGAGTAQHVMAKKADAANAS